MDVPPRKPNQLGFARRSAMGLSLGPELGLLWAVVRGWSGLSSTTLTHAPECHAAKMLPGRNTCTTLQFCKNKIKHYACEKHLSNRKWHHRMDYEALFFFTGFVWLSDWCDTTFVFLTSTFRHIGAMTAEEQPCAKASWIFTFHSRFPLNLLTLNVKGKCCNMSHDI